MESEDKKPIFTKKRILIGLAIILLILIIFLLLRNCSGSKDNNYGVAYISVSPASFGLKVGESAQVYANVYPSDATNKNVYWSSSDDSVAIVDTTTGLVTGVKEGVATITAISEDGGRTASSYVTVSSDLPDLTAIQLDKSVYNVLVGRMVLIVVTPAPTNASLPQLIYTIDNPNIATVDETGVIRGISVGTTSVTVTTADSLHSATATVKVTKTTTSGEVVLPTNVPVSSISFLKTNLTQVCADSVIQLSYEISPNNATNKEVTWSLDNPTDKTNMVNKYASINKDGLLTGVSDGTVVVTVTSKDDPKIYSKITIKVNKKGSSSCGSSSGGNTNPNPSGNTPSSETSSVTDGVTCNVSYEKGNGNWYKRFNVSWSFTPSMFSDDAYSERKYCIDNVCKSFDYGYSVNLQSGKTEHIYGYSYVDKNGVSKKGSCNPSTVMYVDTVKPSCSIGAIIESGVLKVVVKATDATSGIAKIQLNGTSKSYSGNTNYDVTYTADASLDNGVISKQYSALVYDAAGNEGTCSAVIDNQASVTEKAYVDSVYLNVDTSSIMTNQTKNFTAHYVLSSGIITYPESNEFTVSGGSISGSNGNYTFTPTNGSTKGSISLTTKNGYNGKVLTAGPKTFNIANEAAILGVDMNVTGTIKNGWYTGPLNVSATARYSDTTQSTKTLNVCISKGTICTPTSKTASLSASAETGTYGVYYKLVTNGSSEYSGRLGYIKVDNSAPTCSISKISDTTGSVTFTDVGSGIESIYLGSNSVTPNALNSSTHNVSLSTYAGKNATVTDKVGKTATCTFDQASALKLSRISLADYKWNIKVGTSSNIGYTVFDSNGNINFSANNVKVTNNTNSACFSVSASKGYLTISSNTTLSLPCSGSYTIASTYDSSITAVGEVTVNPQTISSISIPDMTLSSGESKTITPTITPTNATGYAISWSSSNTSCATVVSGKVTAKNVTSTCTTIITAKVGNLTSTAKVTVTSGIPAPGLSFACGVSTYVEGSWCRYNVTPSVSNLPTGAYIASCVGSGCNPTNVSSVASINSTTTSGTFCVAFKVGDTYGPKTCKTMKVNIDKVIPTCSISLTSDYLVTTVNETGSGISSGDTANPNWVALTANTFKRTNITNSTYTFTVKDKAGNTGSCSIALTLQYQSRMNYCSSFGNYTVEELDADEEGSSCTDTSSKKGTVLSYYQCSSTTKWRYNSAAYFFGEANTITCSLNASSYNYTSESAAISACKSRCSSYTYSTHPNSKWVTPCTASKLTYTNKTKYTAGTCNTYTTGVWNNVNSCSNYKSVYATVDCKQVLVAK